MKNRLLEIYYKILKIKDKIIVVYNKNITLKKRKPVVKNTDETLNKIIDEKASMSRFGDGEFALMYGENLKFQSYNHELAQRLKEIIKSCNENHIVGIPYVFNDRIHLTEKADSYWNKYLELNSHKIYKLLDFSKTYYDTQVTRLYIDTRDKELVKERFNKIRSLWNNRDIVLIEGAKSKLGIGNVLFRNANSIERIICPSKNTFDKYDFILTEAKKIDKTKLILVALGPTATVLSYDLYKLGYQVLDIGHIDIEYEWFLKGVSEKCPVKNKYIGEVDNGDVVLELNDDEYETEIIKRIK